MRIQATILQQVLINNVNAFKSYGIWQLKQLFFKSNFPNFYVLFPQRIELIYSLFTKSVLACLCLFPSTVPALHQQFACETGRERVFGVKGEVQLSLLWFSFAASLLPCSSFMKSSTIRIFSLCIWRLMSLGMSGMSQSTKSLMSITTFYTSEKQKWFSVYTNFLMRLFFHS